jgi:hypothetical protein
MRVPDRGPHDGPRIGQFHRRRQNNEASNRSQLLLLLYTQPYTLVKLLTLYRFSLPNWGY